ncbi:MAG: PilZ domain-containing protein [candidate division NC10 bacterium]|nr:PilZ domain-containing protein [candidate division NC10 bacterium]
MPKSSAQRRHPRHPLVLSILYKSKDPAPAKVGVGWTRDVSDGGACLELAEPLQPGTPLSVILQTDQGSLGVEGKVVWVGGPVAGGGGVLHGVAFLDATPELLCRPKGDAGPPLQGETGDVSILYSWAT